MCTYPNCPRAAFMPANVQPELCDRHLWIAQAVAVLRQPDARGQYRIVTVQAVNDLLGSRVDGPVRGAEVVHFLEAFKCN